MVLLEMVDRCAYPIVFFFTLYVILITYNQGFYTYSATSLLYMLCPPYIHLNNFAITRKLGQILSKVTL